MKNKVIIIALISLATAFFLLTEIRKASEEFMVSDYQMPEFLINALEIKKDVRKMTLEEKVGQMFLINFSGVELNEEALNWMRLQKIGGIILLGGNVESEKQSRELIKELKEAVSEYSSHPIFIAVDQEGGRVSRFKFLKELISQSDILNEDKAYSVGYERGKELRDLGVNVNFSPVLDLAENSFSFIYSRAFRGDENKVAELGVSMVKGYKAAGIISVAKHFPGHGGTAVDSHWELPIIKATEDFFQKDIYPFRQAIRANVDMIMVGHLKVPELDSVYPASLSLKIIDGFLRKELSYSGVVITDDLGMGAVSNYYSVPEAALLAIKAGADIVLIVRSIEDISVAYSRIIEAVKKGEISESRIDKSVRRILVLKSKIR